MCILAECYIYDGMWQASIMSLQFVERTCRQVVHPQPDLHQVLYLEALSTVFYILVCQRPACRYHKGMEAAL